MNWLKQALRHLTPQSENDSSRLSPSAVADCRRIAGVVVVFVSVLVDRRGLFGGDARLRFGQPGARDAERAPTAR